ncbi:MAG TPA: molybdenum cofactor guanylyltransferase [Dehalococcoidia bacterium]|nr:molybdenum cofactor guanylyltransferase [Dehalococcoidia bacterium]
MDISCIILAGGKSLRLGHDKITEKVGNKTLLEKVISRIDSLCKDIVIVTAEERSFAESGDNPKIKTVSDIFPGRGSLGGIYTGLVKSESFYNLVIAADMPFLNRDLVAYMTEVAEGFDFVIPRIGSYFEPLHSIYSKNCVPPIETMIKNNRRIIIELFDFVKVRYVEAEEIDRFDPEHMSFFNINTMEDLELARKIDDGAKD